MRSFSLNRRSFWSNRVKRLRLFSPKLLTWLVLLLSLTPTYLPKYSSIRPCFTLIPVFYWAVYRPQNFSVMSAFFTGLFLDLLEGTPLGVNTVVFSVFYLLVDSQRRFLFGKSFVLLWFGFAILSFIAYLLKWFLVSIYYAQFVPINIVFVSFILLLLCYPVLVWFCAKLYVYLLDKEK